MCIERGQGSRFGFLSGLIADHFTHIAQGFITNPAISMKQTRRLLLNMKHGFVNNESVYSQPTKPKHVHIAVRWVLKYKDAVLAV